MSRFPLYFAFSFLLFGLSAADAAPKVVTSIKPLHSLTASIMEGVGEPHLLIEGLQSPHGFALKPSDARMIEEADLVVWASPELESFLERALKSLNKDVKSVMLDHDEEGDHDHDQAGHHEDHDKHEHTKHEEQDDHEGHHHDRDVHFWLNPTHVMEFIPHLVEELSEVDPQNHETYEANAKKLQASLTKLDQDLKAQLSPIAHVPFVVFHDAYGHLQERYGLDRVHVISQAPHKQPGAKRLAEIRDVFINEKIKCVFAEPQFPTKLIDRLSEGTDVKTARLDPLGAGLEKGPTQYDQMMRAIGTALADCLAD